MVFKLKAPRSCINFSWKLFQFWWDEPSEDALKCSISAKRANKNVLGKKRKNPLKKRVVMCQSNHVSSFAIVSLLDATEYTIFCASAWDYIHFLTWRIIKALTLQESLEIASVIARQGHHGREQFPLCDQRRPSWSRFAAISCLTWRNLARKFRSNKIPDDIKWYWKIGEGRVGNRSKH